MYATSVLYAVISDKFTGIKFEKILSKHFYGLEYRLVEGIKMSKLLFSRSCIFGLIIVGATGVIAQDSLPKVIKGGILNGKAVSLPKPEYPEAAKAAKVEGKVVVDVVIGEDGTVESAVAAVQPEKFAKPGGAPNEFEEIQPTDPMLREAAEKAALQAKFSPTTLSGQPVKIRGKLVYNFSLKEQRFTVIGNSREFGNVSGSPRKSNQVSGGVLNGRALSLPPPEYPAAARAVNASGAVSVQVLIDENGAIIAAHAVSGHPLLRAASVLAARQATFAPTLLEGQPIKVSGLLVYNFVP